jgi:hypothetical protein
MALQVTRGGVLSVLIGALTCEQTCRWTLGTAQCHHHSGQQPMCPLRADLRAFSEQHTFGLGIHSTHTEPALLSLHCMLCTKKNSNMGDVSFLCLALSRC